MEKDTMQKKEEKKYVVYENDLKFRDMRNIDINKADWATDDIKDLSAKDFDTITYRLKQCKQGGFQSLDFSRLKLKKFPDLSLYNHFEDLKKNLKYLFLDNNDLIVCDDKIKHFKYLEVLDISFNKITDILYLPPYLKELNCNTNLLKSIGHHDHLKMLDCSTNQIELLGNYINLTDLICFDNKLSRIQNYGNLNRLICKKNPIVTISDQPSLTHLDCSETNVTNNICNMPKLSNLICNHTKISDISGFTKLDSLEMVGCNFKIPYIKSLRILLCKNYEDMIMSDKYVIEREITEQENSCILFVTK